MDVVYICRPGPNEELRYSIRSVEKNVPHRKIWVVGQKPDWYTGNFIQVDSNNSKYSNARANLDAAVKSNDISENFILMNDDFFVMRKIEKIAYFYSGTLLGKIQENQALTMPGLYTKLLHNTYTQLVSLGIDNPLNYEMHIPMIVNKEKFKSILRFKTCLWRSLYGNIYDVRGVERSDVKVYSPGQNSYKSYHWKNKNFPFLSTQDSSFPTVHDELLSIKLKDPSSLEK